MMEMELGREWSVRVADLKQFDYCPRVVYYEYCLPGVRPTTFKMEAGEAAQKKVEELEGRRSLRAYGVEEGRRHFYVAVTSPRLHCTGQVDLVIETEEGGVHRLIPVDFKLSRREPDSNVKLQLTCYGLLLEESWGLPVAEGYIYLIPGKRAVRVALTAQWRRKAEQAIREIYEMVEAERMPAPTPRRGRCVSCEFRRFCNDVI